AVTPTIEAKIQKGFLSSDRVWTCYRRNYIAVSVSFRLNPWIANGRLYLNQGGSRWPEQIQSMAMSLSAAVDGVSKKSIELIQCTPKRSQLPMKKKLLSPTPPGKSHNDHTYGIGSFHTTTAMAGPRLPLQTEVGQPYQYTFERIQFESATANNGKRWARQQHYHLVVELWANVQNLQEPRWVKIATRSSPPVVVIGRSPCYFPKEGPRIAGAQSPDFPPDTCPSLQSAELERSIRYITMTHQSPSSEQGETMSLLAPESLKRKKGNWNYVAS
ncbi:p53-like transcription factor, partial [Zopfia rhizophila CBS 207.26]